MSIVNLDEVSVTYSIEVPYEISIDTSNPNAALVPWADRKWVRKFIREMVNEQVLTIEPVMAYFGGEIKRDDGHPTKPNDRFPEWISIKVAGDGTHHQINSEHIQQDK